MRSTNYNMLSLSQALSRREPNRFKGSVEFLAELGRSTKGTENEVGADGTDAGGNGFIATRPLDALD
jgi:hypothetical protein